MPIVDQGSILIPAKKSEDGFLLNKIDWLVKPLFASYGSSFTAVVSQAMSN